MLQALLTTKGADKGGVVSYILVCAIHAGVEIGFDLEQLAEVLIPGVEEIIRRGLPDENHFSIQGDGFGPQALGSDEAQPLPGLLYGDLFIPEGSLQAVPREDVAQHLFGGEHQVTAVGPVEGAFSDHGEVGDQGPELGLLLYAAKEVVVGGIDLHDHRCPLELGVVHHHVHFVFPEGRLLSPRHGKGRSGLGLSSLPEQGEVLHDVIPHLLQVGHDLRKVPVLLHQFINRGAYGEERYLLIQLLQRFVGFLIQAPHLPHSFLQLLLQALPLLQQFLSHFQAQSLEFLFAEGLSLHHGNDQQAHRAHLEQESFLLSLLAHLREELLLLFLKTLNGLLLLGGIFIALEDSGDLTPRPIHQVLRILLEFPPFARRQAEGVGAIGVTEVIHVAPIGGHSFAPGHFLQEALDGRGLPCARGASHVNIEPQFLDPQPKLESSDRPLLANDGFEGLHLLGGLAAQHLRVADPSQLINEQFFCHLFPPNPTFHSPNSSAMSCAALRTSPAPIAR